MKINATNINFDQLESIAAASIASLETSNRADAKRWSNAIRKAVTELTTNPYWQFADGELLIKSDKSDKIYTANGTCFDSDGEPCKAFANNRPCFHRSASRLLLRMAEQA